MGRHTEGADFRQRLKGGDVQAPTATPFNAE